MPNYPNPDALTNPEAPPDYDVVPLGNPAPTPPEPPSGTGSTFGPSGDWLAQARALELKTKGTDTIGQNFKRGIERLTGVPLKLPDPAPSEPMDIPKAAPPPPPPPAEKNSPPPPLPSPLKLDAPTNVRDLFQPPAEDPAPMPSAPTAPTSPMQDPRFAAFLADRAQARADLAAAQGKGEEAAKWEKINNGFRESLAILLNRPFDEGAARARVNDEANRPVEAVKQRLGVDQDVLASTTGQEDLQDKMLRSGQLQATLDPNSEASKRAYQLAVSQGLIPPTYPSSQFSAFMYDDMMKGANIEKANRHYAEQIAMMGQHYRDWYDVMMGRNAQKGAGQPLSANIEQKIKSRINGIRSMADLKDGQNSSGVGDLGAMVTYGNLEDAAAPEIAAANQPTGRESPMMVRGTKGEFPTRFTPNAKANVYFDNKLKQYISDATADIKSARAEGHDTSGMEEQLADAIRYAQGGQSGSASGSGAPSADYDAAARWLQQNPNDPRAAKVREILKGMK